MSRPPRRSPLFERFVNWWLACPLIDSIALEKDFYISKRLLSCQFQTVTESGGEAVALARLSFLSKAEEDLIHQKSVECLEKIGVLVRSKLVLETLAKAGITVDMRSGIAKISESAIDEALRTVPKQIRLCARDPKRDLPIPVDSWPFVATTGLGVYVKDFDTGQTRPSTARDLAAFVKLGDALDPVDFVSTALTATDVPQVSHGLHELWITMQNSSKHVQGVSVGGAEDARTQIKLASLVSGGEEVLRKRPVFSVICCSIAPLLYEKGIVEGMVEFARAGVPIASMTMSLSGGSAPITLAGTVMNGNAENLASLVITQTVAPGAPHIYSSSSTPINMKTGAIDYMAVEHPLICAALGQMARRYRLPSLTGDWDVNDKKELGIPHSLSEEIGMTLSMMGGTDLATGMGGLDAVKGASLIQLVIDAYVWENVRPFMRRIPVDEEKIALDVIGQVGHGNTFLTHPHTLRNFRKELHFWDRSKLEWEATLSDRMVPKAKEVATRLLAEHQVQLIDPDVVEQGNELIRSYEKRFAG